MLHGRRSVPDALSLFAARYRHDPGFHKLVRDDIRAALAEMGIAVPRGVSVAFAPNAAHALSMTLDRRPAAVSASPVSANVLDDAELLDVVGGAGVSNDVQEVRNFLTLLKLHNA